VVEDQDLVLQELQVQEEMVDLVVEQELIMNVVE
tara:strand:+ start:288 stop:389 length:102 start_codon:yes stop_codon:yes gene_type:complete